MYRTILQAFVIQLALTLLLAAQAQSEAGNMYAAEIVAEGLTSPLHLETAPGDASHYFIVDSTTQPVRGQDRTR